MTHELGPLPAPDSYEYLHAADTFIKSFRPETVRAYTLGEVARAVAAERAKHAGLLEALQDVLAWGTDENYERAKASCDKARAAIAQAHGQTPGSQG